MKQATKYLWSFAWVLLIIIVLLPLAIEVIKPLIVPFLIALAVIGVLLLLRRFGKALQASGGDGVRSLFNRY
ncbi:hypothetical protein ACWFRF_15365 [Nocardia sp. NPDC055165]